MTSKRKTSRGLLLACLIVAAIALVGVGVLVLGEQSDAGLVAGVLLLMAAALGGIGVAGYSLRQLYRDPPADGTPPPPGSMEAKVRREIRIASLIGAVAGPVVFVAWVVPQYLAANPNAPTGPVLWVSAIVAGLIVGALSGPLLWLWFRS